MKQLLLLLLFTAPATTAIAQQFRLPRTADPEIAAAMAGADLWYDHRSMPRVYQFAGPSPSSEAGVHLASYNISADPNERVGNGAAEFPWRHPAGTDFGKVLSNRFLKLPRDASGAIKPIVVYRTSVPQRSSPGFLRAWAWSFPVDTIVGEVLMLPIPAAVRTDVPAVAFEIRVRKREADDWGVDVLRPFVNEQELRAAAPVVVHERLHVQDKIHPVAALQVGPATVPKLGPMDHRDVLTALQTAEFRSVAGSDFSYTQDQQEFHLVPRKYFAGVFGSERDGCRNCHRHTGRSVDEFDAGRDWYGTIPGSEGILSFHPFDPSAISSNGGQLPVRLSGRLLSQGLIARYDPGRHQSYNKLNFGRGEVRTVANYNKPAPYRAPSIDYDLIAEKVLQKLMERGLPQGPAGRDGPPGPAGKQGPAGPPYTPDLDQLRQQLGGITISIYDEDGETLIGSETQPLGGEFKLQLRRLGGQTND